MTSETKKIENFIRDSFKSIRGALAFALLPWVVNFDNLFRAGFDVNYWSFLFFLSYYCLFVWVPIFILSVFYKPARNIVNSFVVSFAFISLFYYLSVFLYKKIWLWHGAVFTPSGRIGFSMEHNLYFYSPSAEVDRDGFIIVLILFILQVFVFSCLGSVFNYLKKKFYD